MIATSPDTQYDIQFIADDFARHSYFEAALDTVGLLLPSVSGLGKYASKIDDGLKWFRNTKVGSVFDDVCKGIKGLFKRKVKLSKSNIKHIGKHIPSIFDNQVDYLSKEALEKQLKRNSFFNPNWSSKKIISAVEEGYNAMSKQGLTGLQSYEVDGEIIKIFIKSDGTFDTAYGLHKLTAKFFGK